MSAKTDWQNKDLRAAAVEYALQQCGRRPASSPGEWQRAVSECAVALGVPVIDLAEWMDAKSLQPDVISSAEEMPVNVPEQIPDILIDDESRALSERLRAIVEHVFPRESIHAVTWEEFWTTTCLKPGDTWRQVRVAPLDGKSARDYRTIKGGRNPERQSRKIKKGRRPKDGARMRCSAVEISRAGRVVSVRLYATANQHGNRLKIYQLRPVCHREAEQPKRRLLSSSTFTWGTSDPIFSAPDATRSTGGRAIIITTSEAPIKELERITIDAEGIIRRMAVIESVLHPERPNEGQALAELLDVSEPAVHYRRKAMADWIKERTGGKSGLPGMLNKDQSNKGRAKS